MACTKQWKDNLKNWERILVNLLEELDMAEEGSD